MRAALALLAVVACKGAEPTAVEPRPGSGSGSAPAPGAAVIPAGARELVVGVVETWDATEATLRRYRREAGAWRAVGDAWPGVVGRTGVAWGAGLHGTGAPAGRDGPVKREGDGKSPAGAFAVRGVYGYATEAPAGARLAYTPVDAAWKCVDDPASRHYDQILDARAVTVDWKSAEEMRRADPLYAWVVDLAHNPARTPGGGSCIFFHVWSGPGSTTSGCTAMDEPVLRELVATLDPASVYVLLPRAEYDALAAVWGLPALTR